MMLPATSFCKSRNNVLRLMKLSYKIELEKQHLIVVSPTSSLLKEAGFIADFCKH